MSDEIEQCRNESRKSVWNYTPGVFRERFVTPFQQYAERIGQRFTVIGRDYEAEAGLDEFEFMYRIRFEDGTEIAAWGEEVCIEATNP